MRAPGDGFDGSFVAAFLLAPAVRPPVVKPVPDEYFVIVSAGGELAGIGVPAQAADFLFVALEFGEELRGRAHIAVQD